MFRLRSKMVLTFSAIILISTLLMVIFINYSTQSGYENFAKKNDINLAKDLASEFLDFYKINESWKGINRNRELIRRFNLNNSDKRRQNGAQRTGFNSRFPPIILTDSVGNIILNSQMNPRDNRSKIDNKYLALGIPIVFEKEVVGLIFTGSMIGHKLTKEESQFLGKIRLIIIFVSLFILIIAIVISYFFSWKLTKPIINLSKSAKEIRDGKYSSRVDISGRDELTELGKSFNQMASSLEDADRWRKQLIADSAHELRTPVSLIQGNLEMILDGVYEANNLRIQNIYDETLVLSRLITELQELSSAEAGNMVIKKEEISIPYFINNILEIFKVGEKQKEIKLINNLDKSLPNIIIDVNKIKQVFSNVLANAFRHTPPKGEIVVSAIQKMQSIIFKIEDSGSGVKKEDLEKIFDRFYRIDNARNREHGGSGLGLAISREIIKLHNGSIYAESEIGKGTAIIIILPI